MAKRYVKIPVLVLSDGTKITVDKLKYNKREDFPDEYQYGNSWRDVTSEELTEFVFDIQKQTFVDSFVVDYYPELKYVVGQEYFVEQNHHDLKREVLKEIKFDNYECLYQKYKELPKHYVEMFTPEQKTMLIPSSLIEIRRYKPTYVFESGYETEWEHKLYSEVK